MIYHPIPASQARALIRQHISNPRTRAGLKWFMVYDLQYYPAGRRNLYLIANANGLTGVCGVDAGERRAA